MNFFIYVVIRMKICYVAGYISVRTTALAEDSTVARMERLVEVAQSSRSKTQRLIDACAKYYTPGTPARSPPRDDPSLTTQNWQQFSRSSALLQP